MTALPHIYYPGRDVPAGLSQYGDRIHQHSFLAYGTGNWLAKVYAEDPGDHQLELLATLVGADLTQQPVRSFNTPRAGGAELDLSTYSERKTYNGDPIITARILLLGPTIGQMTDYGLTVSGVITQIRNHPSHLDPEAIITGADDPGFIPPIGDETAGQNLLATVELTNIAPQTPTPTIYH